MSTFSISEMKASRKNSPSSWLLVSLSSSFIRTPFAASALRSVWIAVARVTAAAASYLGRTIEADGNTTQLAAGAAHWTYEVEGASNAIVLTITDANGRLVRTVGGDTTLGKRSFVWDGNDNAGNAAPEGVSR